MELNLRATLRAEAEGAVVHLLQELWDSELFSAAALTKRAQWLNLLKDTLKAVGLLAVGVVFELMAPSVAPGSSIGAKLKDEGAAATGTGDSIFIPFFRSPAATHPWSVRIKWFLVHLILRWVV